MSFLLGNNLGLQAMYMSMTVREHLQLHAALKGVAQPQSLAVETALQAMQLSGNCFMYTSCVIASPSHHN